MIAATENDSVYALSRATGKTIWRAHVGTPVTQSPPNGCGNIYPLGITGTPIYDAANGLVYAVAEVTGYHHMLVALDAATGALKLKRVLDIPTAANQPAYNQQRPGLAIDDGRVYATFGGLSGDCGAYQGSVVSAPLAGDGPLTQLAHPDQPGGRHLGNGRAGRRARRQPVGLGRERRGRGRRPLRRQRLGHRAQPGPAARSPTSRRPRGRTTTTTTSTSARPSPSCAGGAVFIMGKRGVGYLLDAANPGGIGGQLAQQQVCKAFGAAAVSGSVVYEPCRDDGGLAAVQVSAADKTIKVLWRGPGDSNGSPVVGGGAVWVTTYSDNGPGTLYELNPATGQVRHQIAISDEPAALLVAVAERRHRLRQHADRHHRGQRRLTRRGSGPASRSRGSGGTGTGIRSEWG